MGEDGKALASRLGKLSKIRNGPAHLDVGLPAAITAFALRGAQDAGGRGGAHAPSALLGLLDAGAEDLTQAGGDAWHSVPARASEVSSAEIAQEACAEEGTSSTGTLAGAVPTESGGASDADVPGEVEDGDWHSLPGQASEVIVEVPVPMTQEEIVHVPAIVQQPRNHHIRLIVEDPRFGELQFTIGAATPLRKLVAAYCGRRGLQASQVGLIWGEETITCEVNDTARDVGLEDGDVIEAFIVGP